MSLPQQHCSPVFSGISSLLCLDNLASEKDAREASATYEELESHPLWSVLPAVQAGQLGYWRAGSRPTYRGFNPVITEIVETIRASRDDVI